MADSSRDARAVDRVFEQLAQHDTASGVSVAGIDDGQAQECVDERADRVSGRAMVVGTLGVLAFTYALGALLDNQANPLITFLHVS